MSQTILKIPRLIFRTINMSFIGISCKGSQKSNDDFIVPERNFGQNIAALTDFPKNHCFFSGENATPLKLCDD